MSYLFPAECAFLLFWVLTTAEDSFDALDAEPMGARKLAGLDHDHHTDCAVWLDFFIRKFFVLFFLFFSIQFLVPDVLKFLNIVLFCALDFVVYAGPDFLEFLVGNGEVELLEEERKP